MDETVVYENPSLKGISNNLHFAANGKNEDK